MQASCSEKLNASPDLAQISRKEGTILAAGKVLKTHRNTWLEYCIHVVTLQKPELVASILINNINEKFFEDWN